MKTPSIEKQKERILDILYEFNDSGINVCTQHIITHKNQYNFIYVKVYDLHVEFLYSDTVDVISEVVEIQDFIDNYVYYKRKRKYEID